MSKNIVRLSRSASVEAKRLSAATRKEIERIGQCLMVTEANLDLQDPFRNPACCRSPGLQRGQNRGRSQNLLLLPTGECPKQHRSSTRANKLAAATCESKQFGGLRQTADHPTTCPITLCGLHHRPFSNRCCMGVRQETNTMEEALPRGSLPALRSHGLRNRA